MQYSQASCAPPNPPVLAVLRQASRADRPFLHFFFFFLMIRGPPRSPPFPYTTLFRSGDDVPQRLIEEGTRRRAEQATRAVGRQDRKSTRLNSSHTIISYAVFCFKK